MASFGKKIYHQDADTNQSDFSLLPEGFYGMEITESDYGDVGRGKQVKFVATILAPAEYEGKTLHIREWHEHENETSQRIGNNNLAKIARACGLDNGYEATEDFHSRPFVAKVGFGKPYERKKDGIPMRDDNGDVLMARGNEVKRYYFPEEDAPEPFVASPDIPPIGSGTGKPANDNRAAANDNSSARSTQSSGTTATGTAGKSRPWGKK